MASVTDNFMETDDEYVPPVKLKKTTSEVDHNDLYCFECHDEGDVICCDTCPRVYHPKCLALTTLPEDDDWTCPECKILQADFNITNHSMAEFHTMLKFALRRMKSHPQAAPFMQPVDSEQMPEYLDYIIHPMDLETLDKNIDLKKYTSTDAFIGDVKWITHNSVVFNGGQSKFTAVARALLKIARHEMTEIEICSECYLRSAQPLTPDWFAEPCTIPHTLCWAKMKGYQPWPAKVLRIVNDEVDVRFFGQHDRAWVSINNCFVLSKEYPGLEKKKSNANFEKSLTELQTHIDKLKTVYGTFNYAPSQTPLSKTKPFKFVSTIDDGSQPTYVTIGINSSVLRSSIKSVKPARSPVSQLSAEPTTTAKTTTKRANEDSPDQQETVKRARVSSRTSEDASTSGSRIVLRIRKPSEDLSSNRSDTSNSSSSHQVTVQIKEPLLALQEDEEDDQTESPPALVVDMQNHTEDTSDSSHKDDEARSASPTSQPSPACPTPPACIPNEPVRPACASPIEYVDPNATDVRLTMHALLDAVDALKSISEVRTHPPPLTINEPPPVQLPFAERRTTAKQPRKSRLQHRIVAPQPKPLALSHIALPSDERSGSERILSPASITVPLRPLSISPASVDTAEESGALTNDDVIPTHRSVAKSKSIDTLNVKSEPIDSDNHAQRRPIQPTAPIKSSPTSSSPTMSTKSFLISPPAVPHLHKTKAPIPAPSTTSTPSLPTMIPNSNATFAPRISSAASQKATWPPTSSSSSSSSSQIPSSTRQPPNTASKRPIAPLHPPTALRNSSPNPTAMRRTPPATTLQPQSFDMFAVNPPAQRRPNGLPPPTVASTTPPLPARNPPPRVSHPTDPSECGAKRHVSNYDFDLRRLQLPQFNNHAVRPPIDDHQTPAEIQTIVKTFNDKFQQLLTDFTVKIESALESNRVKYERELEETRRSYRLSMNELRTVTTQQVQEMHNSLELQYWTRLSEMRGRLEPHHQPKAPKQLNGAPR